MYTSIYKRHLSEIGVYLHNCIRLILCGTVDLFHLKYYYTNIVRRLLKCVFWGEFQIAQTESHHKATDLWCSVSSVMLLSKCHQAKKADIKSLFVLS